MEKTKTISAITSFVIELFIPLKKLLLQHLNDVEKTQEITLQTHFLQLLIIYIFTFFVLFFGIYGLLRVFGFGKKN